MKGHESIRVPFFYIQISGKRGKCQDLYRVEPGDIWTIIHMCPNVVNY